MKTAQQWNREARRIIKGATADHFLANDDLSTARGLFREDQTVPVATADDADNWTRILTREEWEAAKRAQQAQRRFPKIKIRASGDGASVWCGPNKVIIKALKSGGWHYQADHYWYHPAKNPTDVAMMIRHYYGDLVDVEMV